MSLQILIALNWNSKVCHYWMKFSYGDPFHTNLSGYNIYKDQDIAAYIAIEIWNKFEKDPDTEREKVFILRNTICQDHQILFYMDI